jgi:hypothetical protein
VRIWSEEEKTQLKWKSEGIWLKRKKREWVGVIQEERRAHGKSKSAQQSNQVALIRYYYYYFKRKWKLGVVFVTYERVFGVPKTKSNKTDTASNIILSLFCSYVPSLRWHATQTLHCVFQIIFGDWALRIQPTSLLD